MGDFKLRQHMFCLAVKFYKFQNNATLHFLSYDMGNPTHIYVFYLWLEQFATPTGKWLISIDKS